MEKIDKLKKFFEEEEIDGYLIPKNDEFFGEYIPFYNDRLNFISNFSGSYGFALILKNKNYLFVDGRYTLQANRQSGRLFNIVTVPDNMPCDVLKGKKLSIGFDPKLFTKKSLSVFFEKNNFKLKTFSNNFVDQIWKRRIKKNKKKYFYFFDDASFKINSISLIKFIP